MSKAAFTFACLDRGAPADERARTLAAFPAGRPRALIHRAPLCLDTQTEILTDNGWVGVDVITPAHRVANWDDGLIFFAEPKEIVRRARQPSERMVCVDGHRSEYDIRVTESHRMVYRGRSTTWGKRGAYELVGRSGIALPANGVAAPLDVDPQRPPALSDTHQRTLTSKLADQGRRSGCARNGSFREARRCLAHRRGLRYPRPSELSLDECRLVGFSLGDCPQLQRGESDPALTQAKAHPAIVAWLDALLDRLDLSSAQQGPADGRAPRALWSLSRATRFGLPARRGVFHLESYMLAIGSRLLWGLDVDQFAAFLEGWSLADGNHRPGTPLPAACSVTSTGHDLLSLVQAIAAARGFQTSLRPHGPDRRQVWRLSFSRCAELWLEGDGVRYDDGWCDEEVWCVRTHSRNIVTRRNGTVVVVGNTEGWDESTVGPNVDRGPGAPRTPDPTAPSSARSRRR